MSRHRSRHRAVQVLYQTDVRGIGPEEAIRNYYGGLYTGEAAADAEEESAPEGSLTDTFMEDLVHGVGRRRGEIDGLLQRVSANWRVERMPAVDRNILRLAVFEMLDGKLPPPVVIDEALELARRFSGDESVSFVNGVLDGVRRSLSPPS